MKELIQNKKVVSFIVTLQEAYTAIIPFFLLTSTAALFYSLLTYFNINLPIISKTNVLYVVKTLQSFASIAAVISISYFFATRLKISQAVATTLAILTFISVFSIKNPAEPLSLPYGFSPATLIIPIITTYLLSFLYPRVRLKIPLNDGNYHVYRLFEYIPAAILSSLLTLLIYLTGEHCVSFIFHQCYRIKLPIPEIALLGARNLLVNLFWFIGLHGEHTVNALFGKEILFKTLCKNLTYGEFNRLFIAIGGAGAGMGLLIALLALVKKGSLKTITNISVPLVEFNINTLLIYAAVVLNRFLFIPFVLLPTLNLIIGYIFIKTVNINFTNFHVVWNTPVFIDIYLKTGGDLKAISLQIFLILVDGVVYGYFVQKFLQSGDLLTSAQLLERNLNVSDNLEIPEEIEAKEGIYAFKAKKELIDAQARLDSIVRSLTKDNLFIYYQPQIDVKKNKCSKFEALIRYRHNGKITGPTFLSIIEKAGLAPIIDVWVCKEVKNNLIRWKNENFYPEVSVNLHPDTVKSKDAITKIMKTLEGEKITFEIVERSFLHGKVAMENVKRLKNAGFKISIDDFGVGYSSLETITKCEINELKIDKSLIDIIGTDKGYIVCKNIIELCHEIGIEVVAEGVEREAQFRILKALDVDYIQGFYFSKAIPFDKVKQFAENFSIRNKE
ncbi:EAL domain-containing protein [Desulfurobacterium sp.]